MKKDYLDFQKKILSFYKTHGRHGLVFRKTKNPYAITVAEIMLQQTQVVRVLPKYSSWIKKFPTWKSLANASTQEVLRAWSGLGYNRRALFLRQMAQTIIREHKGKLPQNPKRLLELPGIGPYTSRSILIFAFNADEVTIDTNIRRVLIHELHLPPRTSVKKLEKIATEVLPRGQSRDWHNALMDYATLRLPKTPNIKPLSKQSPFKGSIREIRGVITKKLTTQSRVSLNAIAKQLQRSMRDTKKATRALERDGVVRLSKNWIYLV